MSANELLKVILEKHGLTVTTDSQWLVVNGREPYISANHSSEMKDDRLTIKLDITVRVNAEVTIEESFGAIGEDEDIGLENAFNNFSANSLNVLLYVLWGINKESVIVEDWSMDGMSWNVVIGNFACVGASAVIPEGLLRLIKNAICKTDKSHSLHWCRTYYANIPNNKPISMFLWNNQPIETYQHQLNNLGWPVTNNYYSVRNFIMISPKSDN